jgi:anti-sigma factor RsiW
MNCQETRSLLHPYLDRELDLVRNLQIEEHLSQCPGCSGKQDELRSLRSTLQSSKLYFRAPAGLRRRVRAALPPAQGSFARVLIPFPQYRLLAIAAALAVLLAGVLLMVTNHVSRIDQIAREAAADHVRSLMPGHLMDVASTDQHTVKPWFDGRLDFAPPVVDLAAQGFPLTGGRLDYLGDRTVAALVYQRQKHLINLFIWPAAQPMNSEPIALEVHGYHLLHWHQSGMECWAVSDLNRSELGEFADRFRTEPRALDNR